MRKFLIKFEDNFFILLFLSCIYLTIKSAINMVKIPNDIGVWLCVAIFCIMYICYAYGRLKTHLWVDMEYGTYIREKD